MNHGRKISPKMNCSARKTILIKISGGCLSSSAHEVFDSKKLESLCCQIAEIRKTHNIGIVIGGGNV